jgi:hypothetical protein
MYRNVPERDSNLRGGEFGGLAARLHFLPQFQRLGHKGVVRELARRRERESERERERGEASKRVQGARSDEQSRRRSRLPLPQLLAPG